MVRADIRLVSAAVLSMVTLRAQQPPQIIERVDVSSVVVDARVIDDFGAPILGLTAPNFVVTIGGKPATVQWSMWTAGVSAPQPLSSSASAATVPAAIRSEVPGQLVVLLFQKSLRKEHARGLIRMAENSRELVRQLPPTDRVAIVMFDTSLHVWSDFTSDRKALDRILEHRLLHEKPPKVVAPGEPSLLEAVKQDSHHASTIEQ